MSTIPFPFTSWGSGRGMKTLLPMGSCYKEDSVNISNFKDHFNYFWLLTRILEINLLPFKCIGYVCWCWLNNLLPFLLVHLRFSNEYNTKEKRLFLSDFIWKIYSLLRVNLAVVSNVKWLNLSITLKVTEVFEAWYLALNQGWFQPWKNDL